MRPTSANDLTPRADQVERFRGDLEAITGTAPDGDSKLGIAVSGGPDSVALLLLAAAAYPGAVTAATVDHGLRAQSADEAAFVGRLCEALGVPHAVLRRPSGLTIKGNLQEQARGLRYALLHHWASSDAIRAEWVATAHQLDDVAETFLMRARRGAGVGGLAAMPTARPLNPFSGPSLVRPLLGWPRAELAEIVAAAGVEPVDDPSNRHPRFDRSRIRALLAKTDELPPPRLALAAANLRYAEDALVWVTEREWQARARIQEYELLTLDCSGLPYEVRRRLARRAIEWARFEFRMSGTWRGTGLDRLVGLLESGGTGTIAGVKASAKGAEWRFSAAPARRSH